MTTQWAASLLCTTLSLSALTGCQLGTAENLSLPGTVGTGENAIVITAELPDVGTLTKNAQVKVNDLVVGTVTELKVKNWHAEATLSLKPDTRLPQNLRASVGVNSLLGSSYVELAPASKTSGTRTVASGTTIPLERGHAYPSTEQVLSSASVVLNGGGLEQLETITREANRALDGDGQAFADLLPRLDSFVTALNEQQGDIRTTIRALDGAAGRYADNREVITDALDELGPALEALDEERPELTDALKSLSRLSRVAVPLVDDLQPALVADLRNLQPALDALAAAGPSLVRALGFIITFPFSPDVVRRACVSDYCNVFVTVDLTNQAILDGFLGEDGQLHLPGIGPLPTTLPGILQAPGAAAAAAKSRDAADASITKDPTKQLSETVRNLLNGQAGEGSDATPKEPAKKSGGILGGLLDSLRGNR